MGGGGGSKGGQGWVPSDESGAESKATLLGPVPGPGWHAHAASGAEVGQQGIDLAAARAYLMRQEGRGPKEKRASQLQGQASATSQMFALPSKMLPTSMPGIGGYGLGLGLPMQVVQQPAGQPGGTVPGGHPGLFGGQSTISGMLGPGWGGVVGVNVPSEPPLQQIVHQSASSASEPAAAIVSQSKLSAKAASEIYAFRPPRTGVTRSPHQLACAPKTARLACVPPYPRLASQTPLL